MVHSTRYIIYIYIYIYIIYVFPNKIYYYYYLYINYNTFISNLLQYNKYFHKNIT